MEVPLRRGTRAPSQARARAWLPKSLSSSAVAGWRPKPTRALLNYKGQSAIVSALPTITTTSHFTTSRSSSYCMMLLLQPQQCMMWGVVDDHSTICSIVVILTATVKQHLYYAHFIAIASYLPRTRLVLQKIVKQIIEVIE